MSSHKLPSSITNSEAEYYISEFVRYQTHRGMLRDWWFSQMTQQQIAEKYNYSITHTKELLYKYTDAIKDYIAEKNSK